MPVVNVGGRDVFLKMLTPEDLESFCRVRFAQRMEEAKAMSRDETVPLAVRVRDMQETTSLKNAVRLVGEYVETVQGVTDAVGRGCVRAGIDPDDLSRLVTVAGVNGEASRQVMRRLNLWGRMELACELCGLRDVDAPDAEDRVKAKAVADPLASSSTAT